MKRLALLIGSPSTKQNGDFLAGVQTDIENMYRFLTSSIGGSWQKDEIKLFPLNSSYSQVEPYLKACENADFAFIYYSGHGYTDINNISRAVFNSQSNYNPDIIQDIAKRANHQITIIDACRGLSEFSNFTGPLLEGIEFPNPKPELARDIYDNYVSLLPNTRVLLFATEHGKYSMDYGKEYGGLFSTSLLNVVKSKIQTENKPIFNIAEVFEHAKINTQRIEPKQIPKMYIVDENSYKLPFAIKPDYNVQVANIQKQTISENKTSIAEDIAKGVFIGAGIVAVTFIVGSLFSNRK